MSQERRQDSRETVDHPCWLRTQAAGRLIRAQVSNISAGGAKVIHPGQAEIPDSLDLYMTFDGKVGRHCKVIWRSENAIGLMFVGRATLPPPAELVEI